MGCDKGQKEAWSLCGLCLCVSVVGCTYAFGIFSPLLAQRLNFFQEEIDTIASVGNAGLYTSLSVGYAMQCFGFRRIVMFGGVMIFLGLFYIWMAISGWVLTTAPMIGLFYFIAQTGSCCHISAAISTSISMYVGEVKGSVIGLVKGYFGLSSGILTVLASGLFADKAESFVLFSAILIPLAGIVGAHLVDLRMEPSSLSTSELRLFILHWALLFLALLAASTLQYVGWNETFGAGFAIGLLVLLIALLAIPVIIAVRSTHFKNEIEEDCSEGSEEALPLLALALDAKPRNQHEVLDAQRHHGKKACSAQLAESSQLCQRIASLEQCTCIVQGMLSFGTTEMILPGFLAVGFLFGSSTCLVAVSVAETFGTAFIATNFGFVDASPIFGSFVFATLTVNAFYRLNAVDQAGVVYCVGSECFRGAFLLSSAACAVATVVAVALSITDLRIY